VRRDAMLEAIRQPSYFSSSTQPARWNGLPSISCIGTSDCGNATATLCRAVKYLVCRCSSGRLRIQHRGLGPVVRPQGDDSPGLIHRPIPTNGGQRGGSRAPPVFHYAARAPAVGRWCGDFEDE